MVLDHHLIAIAVRWLHVAAMAMALGGALLVAWLAFREPADRVVGVALRYEQAFWLAAGVLVMTGVGNLGAFGPDLPQPATGWGATFIWKLLLVAAIVVGSLPRTLAVALPGIPVAAALRWMYAGTAAGLVMIAGLAVLLAHG
ncbi:MAG TPA: hypothetical protein VIN34_00165 [Candidatus Limnocylindria bacterium]|jgi:hypothetical protein